MAETQPSVIPTLTPTMPENYLAVMAAAITTQKREKWKSQGYFSKLYH